MAKYIKREWKNGKWTYTYDDKNKKDPPKSKTKMGPYEYYQNYDSKKDGAWTKASNNPFGNSGRRITYYVGPNAGKTFELRERKGSIDKSATKTKNKSAARKARKKSKASNAINRLRSKKISEIW